MVNITIDNKPIRVAEGTTIIEAARSAGINIPSLCYFKGLNEIGACRVCVVEVEGYDRLAASCNTAVEEGMVIHTNSPRVRKARKTNVELLLSQHDCTCATCVRSGNCQLQTIANDLNIIDLPYESDVRANKCPGGSAIVRKESKCIKCMRCVQVCDNVQGLSIWEVTGTGKRTNIAVRGGVKLNKSDCTFCGQCVTHCPTGALAERDDTAKVFAALADPEVTTVVQVAPAVRSAWAEVFGVSREFASPKRMAAALRRIGFNYVFDTNFTADLTIMEEGTEFINRFTHRADYNWPMFTSCCPGWVRFVKGQFPEFTDNLSTAKSPQQMFGAVAKSYFAEKMGIDPKKMFVVSIMPCTSKKTECEHDVFSDACGDPDVDVVLTTREFTRMLRAEHVNVPALPEEDFDSPLGSGTGAAVIFGATGGVMDAALRTAYTVLTGSEPDADAFVQVRGLDGWKSAVFTIPNVGDVRVAVASGLGNTRRLLEAIKAGEVEYDFVEIMACPGGCAGGGGQPIEEGCELAGVRGDNLWELDKKSALRYSHQNPDITAIYKEYFEKPLGEKSHHLLHTDHHAWDMPNRK